MRRATQLVAILSVASVSVLAFQNCAGNQSYSNPLYAQEESSATCLAPACTVDPEALQIQLMSTSPLEIEKPPVGGGGAVAGCTVWKCFDLAGYCDSGGYPFTIFYLEMQGPTSFERRATQATCDSNGRFRILVELPAGFNYGALHQLTVTMKGVDSRGREVDNPNSSGLNRKSIDIRGRL